MSPSLSILQVNSSNKTAPAPAPAPTTSMSKAPAVSKGVLDNSSVTVSTVPSCEDLETKLSTSHIAAHEETSSSEEDSTRPQQHAHIAAHEETSSSEEDSTRPQQHARHTPSPPCSSPLASSMKRANKTKGASLSKSVSFHQVEVRQFERVLGDHPDTVLGPPITIGWDVQRQDSKTLDDYESERSGTRKNVIQLRIHPNTRNRMLLEAGSSKEEIKAATKEANRTQARRKNTAALLEVPIVSVMEEMTQSAKRKFKRRSWRSNSSGGDV